jgi:hypothetical protein
VTKVVLNELPAGDPLKTAWDEAASPDDWGVPRIYETHFCELLAAELRRMAEPYHRDARRERARARRLADGAPKWQYESAITSAQELAAFAKCLTSRADQLLSERAETP